MLFKQVILKGIAAGRITVAFRRWKRPTVREGGTLITEVGLLEIRTVERFDEKRITPAAVKKAGYGSIDELLESLGDRGGELYRIEFRLAGEDPRIELRENDRLSAADIESLRRRLERLDRHGAEGPWTEDVLRLIEQFPERRAGDLADLRRMEKERFKIDVRKLKNLGLTESLEIGYRLSPRGRAYLAAIGRKR